MELIKINKLKQYFRLKNKTLKAVDDVTFSILDGETLGLVGESGCGKSTLGRAIMRIYEPTSGSILFQNEPIKSAQPKTIQMIFQDPYASLNPRMTAGEIIEEPLILQTNISSAARQKRVFELLDLVGLDADHSMRFPHEFSGGQRQRIGIARALALKPKFIVCDEPIAALDVSIQAQIVNLLKKLQQNLDLTYLFISHDLSMVRYLCSRVAVMYLGRLCELAPAKELYANPMHPYTQALLSAIPIPDPEIEKKRERIVLKGDLPSPTEDLPGCPFASRCPKSMPQCHTTRPKWQEVKPNRHIACHLYEN